VFLFLNLSINLQLDQENSNLLVFILRDRVAYFQKSMEKYADIYTKYANDPLNFKDPLCDLNQAFNLNREHQERFFIYTDLLYKICQQIKIENNGMNVNKMVLEQRDLHEIVQAVDYQLNFINNEINKYSNIYANYMTNQYYINLLCTMEQSFILVKTYNADYFNILELLQKVNQTKL
jgi:hypothetical protein